MAIVKTIPGSREGVSKSVDALSADKGSAEESQLPAVKAFIKSEIDSLPAEFNGCTVTVEYHAEKGLRRFTLNVIGQNLHL